MAAMPKYSGHRNALEKLRDHAFSVESLNCFANFAKALQQDLAAS